MEGGYVSRRESTLVGVFLAVACPASLFVVGWWTAGGLSAYGVVSFSDRAVAGIALGGLGLGVFLVILRLRNWLAGFYATKMGWLVLIYVFWSTISLAFCMGLPFGNLGLGALAGVYVGRRERHAGATAELLAASARRAGLFTAVMTGAGALAIGLLALKDAYTFALLQAAPLVGPHITSRTAGLLVVLVACVLLAAVQFWLTRGAVTLAFPGGPAAALMARSGDWLRNSRRWKG